MKVLKLGIAGGVLLIASTVFGQEETPKLDKVFEKWDTNKDGGIDKTEFTVMKADIAEKRSEKGKDAPNKEVDPEKQFARFDVNSDGKIDKAEFIEKKEKAQERKATRD